MNIHVLIAGWLLHQTTAFLRPPLPSAAAARRTALGEGVVDVTPIVEQRLIGEGVVDAAPIVEAPRLIGEGVVLDAVPDASPINAGSLFVLAAIAVAGLAAFVSQNFEPNPNARVSLGLEAASPAVFADRTYYVVRWRSRRDTVYEGLNSVAERAEAGTDVSVRCTSLLEANAQTRRLAKADAGVVAKIYKVTGASVVELEPGGGTTPDAEDEWVGDFTDVVKNAASAPVPGSAPLSTDDDRQAIWDDMLQDEAEAEAAAARSDVDEQWSKYLESLKVTKEVDAVIIGGVDGPAPCRLCNGKGYRVMFGGKGAKEAPCEWCGGKGYEEEDS